MSTPSKMSGNQQSPNEPPTGSRGFRIPAWVWVLATLLLVAVIGILIAVHFLHPDSAPVSNSPGSSGGPEANSPAVPHDTSPRGIALHTLQKDLSANTQVHFTIDTRDTTNNSTSQLALIDEVSSVAADPAQCRLSDHWQRWQDGTLTANNNEYVVLSQISAIAVETGAQRLTENNAQNGKSNLEVYATVPPVTAVKFPNPGTSYYYFFQNRNTALQFARDMTVAVQQCGGNPTLTGAN
jgi:hypothetical protein